MRHAQVASHLARADRVWSPYAAALAAVLLLLTSHCIAQTTAPASATPPAIEGAYEHATLRHADGASATSVHNKTTVSEPQTSPLDIRRVALALGIVLSLVFICRWAARWMFPSVGVSRSSQVMKVLSRSVINPKQQLLLIQVGRRLVVVGDSGQQMSALAEISDPDEVASLLGQLRAEPSANQTSKPFDPLLGRAQRQFEDFPVAPASDEDGEDEAELALAGVDQTRGELNGLTEKIRSLSRQLGKM